MIDLLLLLAALFFGILSVYAKDNVFSAISLSAAAGAVGAYYAYLAQFASAFLIFVIYIGAVMLLVMMTAAMYGGVQRWDAKYILVTSLVFFAALILGSWLWVTPYQPSTAYTAPTDLRMVVILLLGVAAISLVVSIEVAKKI